MVWLVSGCSLDLFGSENIPNAQDALLVTSDDLLFRPTQDGMAPILFVLVSLERLQ